jgi:hypothetical protein
VKTLRAFLLLALVGGGTALHAQDVSARLAGRVSPEVAAQVQRLATAAAARGLPVDPLIQKAIEGTAKGVPADRITAAVRALAGQLDVAAAALSRAGPAHPDTDAIAAGAFALNAGLSDANVTDLARVSAPRHTEAATLRVAGTLAAMGVPATQTVELVTQVIAAGGESADVVALPAQVTAGVSHGQGVTPAQAAAGLARAAAARANAPGQQRPRPSHP